MELEVVSEDGVLRQVFCRNLHVAVWNAAPGVAQLEGLSRAAQQLTSRYGGRSSVVHLVLNARTNEVSSEVRDAARDLLRNAKHRGSGTYVVLQEGLLAAAARGFLGTLVLVARPSIPVKIFGDIPAAAAWTAERLNERTGERWTTWQVSEVLTHALDDRRR
jgi:hypothetical protein